MEVLGKIIKIGETETVGSAGTFKKRLVVVETSEQYSQKIPVDFVQDKTSLLDNYSIGQEVKVSINIRGNEYQGKYYVSLDGWRIESQAPAQSQSAVDNYQGKANPEQEANLKEEEDHDDMPF